MRVHELDATIDMKLYTDHTFTEAYSTSPTIELRDEVGGQEQERLLKLLFIIIIITSLKFNT